MSKRLSRKAPYREIKPRFLIITEGETEENYFNMIKKFFRGIPIEIITKKGKQSNPLSVVKTAHREIKESRNNQYTAAFAVVDKEAPNLHVQCLSNAINEIKKGLSKNLIKCDLIISNPSFEFWLLMHFRYTTSLFHNADAVIEKLKKFIPDYKKAYDFENKTEISQKLDIAIEHSKRCESQHDMPFDPLTSNPSTQVYKVIEKIKGAAISL